VTSRVHFFSKSLFNSYKFLVETAFKISLLSTSNFFLISSISKDFLFFMLEPKFESNLDIGDIPESKRIFAVIIGILDAL